MRTKRVEENGGLTEELAIEGPVTSARPTIQEIRPSQPPPLSEGYLGLWYRTLGLPLVWLFVQAGVTANTVTLLWIATGVIALSLLASGHHGLSIAGAAGLQLVIVLDRVDGDVARFTDTRSFFGKYLDLVGHALIKFLLFVCVGAAVYRTAFSQPWTLLLTITATLGMAIGSQLRFYRAYLLVIRNLKFEKRSPAKNLAHKLFRKLGHLWLTPGLFAVVLLGAIADRMAYVLVFYGVTAPLWALCVSHGVSRELRACDQDPQRGQHLYLGLDAFD